jgi:23S rRNA-intervening sequence protein
MVNYDGLPVYKSSYDLLLMIFEIVKKFEREYKFSLGESIKNECIKLITLIYRANSSQEKRKIYLQEARESLEVLRLYLRLAKDLKILTLEKFIHIQIPVESTSKQLLAWEKSVS